MVRVFLAVGSNLGDRLENLKQARRLLAEKPGIKFLHASRIYETEPVGGPPQGKYLNAVWEAETDLEPGALLARLFEVETALGRQRREPNAPRTIDLDILFYGERFVAEPGLIIPHPRFHERFFVLAPLADLAPGLMHPKFKKTVQQMLEELRAGNPKP